jgi:hypothetical protein
MVARMARLMLAGAGLPGKILEDFPRQGGKIFRNREILHATA